MTLLAAFPNASFLFGLNFYPGDRGDIFLPNVGCLPKVYTEFYIRKKAFFAKSYISARCHLKYIRNQRDIRDLYLILNSWHRMDLRIEADVSIHTLPFQRLYPRIYT
jgi:hypothetical protein